MKCPHCNTGIHESWKQVEDANDPDGQHRFQSMTCAECGRYILRRVSRQADGEMALVFVHPRVAVRPQLPDDVPDPFREDYHEACLVLSDSPKGSAALSRRSLQNLLREQAGVTHGNLNEEIEEAIPKLPGYLADVVHWVRVVGNFAAHPTKSSNTGAVIDVEPGEAELLLDVVEGLLDFFYVRPKILAGKTTEINKKLKEAGKPELKTPSSGGAAAP